MNARLFNKIITLQLESFLNLCKGLGGPRDRREALYDILQLVIDKQGKSIHFKPGVGTCYFTVEFSEVRLMTVSENDIGQLIVEVIDKLPDSAYEVIYLSLSNAITLQHLKLYQKSLVKMRHDLHEVNNIAVL